MQLITFYTQIHDNCQNQTIAIVNDDGPVTETVGSVTWNTGRHPFLKIERLFVKEFWRGSGVAKQLIDKIELDAKNQGCTRSMLTVHLDSLTKMGPELDIQKFWEHQGYELTYIHNCGAGEMTKKN